MHGSPKRAKALARAAGACGSGLVRCHGAPPRAGVEPSIAPAASVVVEHLAQPAREGFGLAGVEAAQAAAARTTDFYSGQPAA